MRVIWSAAARSDLARVYDFLAPKNRPAAERALTALTNAPIRLVEMPAMGARVESFIDRNVRRVIVARHYEMHYEIADSVIRILRIFHTREER